MMARKEPLRELGSAMCLKISADRPVHRGAAKCPAWVALEWSVPHCVHSHPVSFSQCPKHLSCQGKTANVVLSVAWRRAA